MTALKLLTATALAAGLIATPAMAQHYRADRSYQHHDSGFWPGEVAAGVIGGAIGTAGAIATAPFRSDSYAYYNDGYAGPVYGPSYRDDYATRNGFVCRPGTWFRGEDGRRHLCQ